jgi:UDP-N-acetylglucosamine--N-acetylmuramyl-(pentapeptide) pyrophosphoryl-undecaprenol N-acetylglucosamine transferase
VVILFAGGGTGGHLYPALALAEELKGRDPSLEIAFMGTPNRIEATLVPAHGYGFYPIEVMGMPRKLGPELLKFGQTLAGSVSAARRVLRTLKPAVVVGTGGYVSAPAILAGAALGIPTVLCEQNRLPGVANRMLATVAREVMTTFVDSNRYFPASKVHCLGNPIRPDVYRLDRDEARRRLGFVTPPHLLLVTGGSLGARSINTAVKGAARDWLARPDWTVLHVSGRTDFEDLSAETAGLDLGDRYRLVPYLDDMPVAIAASDLVLSRAGATTVSELTAAGKAMVLVPFQHGGKDQPANAQALAEAGAAVVCDDRDLSGLGTVIAGLMDDAERRKSLSAASRQWGRPEAARAIADRILALALAGPALPRAVNRV